MFQQRRVSEIIDVQPRRNKFKTNEYFPTGRIPIIDQGSEFIAGFTDESQRAYDGELPVIVFGDHTCCLKFVDFAFAVGADGTQLLRPADGIDARYLYYALKTAELEQFGYQRHFKLLKDCQVSVPPFEIQRRIASILGAYDDLIQVNLRRIAVLEDMATRLFENHVIKQIEMLPPPHGGQGSSRLPANWQIALLGDISDIIMGQSPPSTQLNKLGEGFPFHQGVTDFGALFPHSRVYCTPSNKKKLAEAGDLLFSVRAPVGRINLATEPVVLGRGIASIRSKIGSSFFLAAHLRATFHSPDLIGNGAIYKAVGRDDIERVPIALPPVELREKIDALIRPIYEVLWALHRSNNALAVSRDLFLPRLISGQLSISAAHPCLEEAA